MLVIWFNIQCLSCGSRHILLLLKLSSCCSLVFVVVMVPVTRFSLSLLALSGFSSLWGLLRSCWPCGSPEKQKRRNPHTWLPETFTSHDNLTKKHSSESVLSSNWPKFPTLVVSYYNTAGQIYQNSLKSRLNSPGWEKNDNTECSSLNCLCSVNYPYIEGLN